MPPRLGWLALSLALSSACGGGAGAGADSRYPEKRRPPPLRSASDGEVLGANQQAPEDTLEALPTNQHPAMGWVVVDGVLVPEREARKRAADTKAAAAGCDPAPGSGSSAAAGSSTTSSPTTSSPSGSTPAGTTPASTRRVKPLCPKPAGR
jgi:hypothetical protein